MRVSPISAAPRPGRLVPIVLAVFAVENLALAALMIAAPGTFFDQAGPFGTRNDHYIRDVSTWNLALGIAALVALRRRAWRLPVLAFAALQTGLHAVNHLVDIDKASKSGVGAFDFASLTITAAIIGWAAWVAHAEGTR